MGARGCLLGVVGLIVAFIAFGQYVQSTKTPEERAKYGERDLRDAACSVLQQQVTKKLKPPSTASFDSCFRDAKIVRLEGEEKFQVTGWVDAQNSFGAMIRSTYVGTAWDSGEDAYKGWFVNAKIIGP